MPHAARALAARNIRLRYETHHYICALATVPRWERETIGREQSITFRHYSASGQRLCVPVTPSSINFPRQHSIPNRARLVLSDVHLTEGLERPVGRALRLTVEHRRATGIGGRAPAANGNAPARSGSAARASMIMCLIVWGGSFRYGRAKHGNRVTKLQGEYRRCPGNRAFFIDFNLSTDLSSVKTFSGQKFTFLSPKLFAINGCDGQTMFF